MKLSSHCEEFRTYGGGFKAKAPPINGANVLCFIALMIVYSS